MECNRFRAESSHISPECLPGPKRQGQLLKTKSSSRPDFQPAWVKSWSCGRQQLLGLASALLSTVPEAAGLSVFVFSTPALHIQNSSVGSEFALGTHQFNPLLVLLELLAQLC